MVISSKNTAASILGLQLTKTREQRPSTLPCIIHFGIMRVIESFNISISDKDTDMCNDCPAPQKTAPRKDVLSWPDYFMALAKLSAKRSKDPSTQVGACIVSSDNRILSIGYNGAPNGYDDDDFPWSREGHPLDTKYLYVVHAERNAILNYHGSRRDLEGATIYIDLFPCNECAKEIIQAGIKHVVYLSDKYADGDEAIASKRLFDKCGVTYTQLHPKEDEVVLDLKVD